MRYTIFILLFVPFFLAAQQEQNIIDFYQNEFRTYQTLANQPSQLTNDSMIDVHFYHLQLMPAIDSAYLAAAATIGMRNLSTLLDTILLDLHHSLQVDSISGSCGFNHQNDSLEIYFCDSLAHGELFSITVHYQGHLELAGGIKGMRHETHGNQIPVIATLSTPYLAHYWYPCKDGPKDKADSVYVDISIPNSVYNGYPLIAVSNGILEGTIETDTTNTFQWRHRHPIVPYYVMMAVSNYVHLGQQYCNQEHCFPLDYYVFANDTSSALQGTAEMPELMTFFEDIFGQYPYSDEKYGMTQLGYYGAIENQTNTITNNMSPSWFMISVHELAHMWYGCYLTCDSWQHAWLNEGFATYAEALWKEYKQGEAAYKAYMMSKAWYHGGTVFLYDIDDPFNIFIPIIYNKGAWVLHMLRYVVGDELFFEGIEAYATHPNFSGGQINTEQFRWYFEQLAETDLDIFFDQWVYDAYYPIYYYNFSQNSDMLGIQLYQAQGETGRRPVFEMPVEMQIEFHDGTDTLIRFYNNIQNQFFEIQLSKPVSSIIPDPNQWILHTAVYMPDLPVGFFEKSISIPVNIYPNPAQNRVFIDLNSNGKKVHLRLSNMQGVVVKEQDIYNGTFFMDISELPPSVYLLDVIVPDLGKTWQKKLVVY